MCKQFSILLLFAAIAFTGCTENELKLFSGTLKGRVLEDETHAPIADAWVVLKYHLYRKQSIIPFPMDHSSPGGCVWSTVVQTNHNGGYVVPKLPSNLLGVLPRKEFPNEFLTFSVYKNGYITKAPRIHGLTGIKNYYPRQAHYPQSNKQDKYIPNFILTKDYLEPQYRLGYLSAYSSYKCKESEEIQSLLIATYKEAKILPIQITKPYHNWPAEQFNQAEKNWNILKAMRLEAKALKNESIGSDSTIR